MTSARASCLLFTASIKDPARSPSQTLNFNPVALHLDIPVVFLGCGILARGVPAVESPSSSRGNDEPIYLYT